jgi:hypothetical protein
MSAQQVNSNVEFVQVNTQTNAGTIQLPNAQDVGGRLITFKDIAGSFQRNPLTLTTITGNTFDDGTSTKILRENFGFIEVISDGLTRWNVVDGTQMPSYTISTLNVVATLSTTSISTLQLNTSTLRLNDSLLANVQSNLYTSSSLLYCSGQIVGGTRVAAGPTQLSPVQSSFSPTQIIGLKAWYDAADLNTLSIDLSGAVRQWRDKSGLNINLTGVGVPRLTKANGLNAINFVNPAAPAINYFTTPLGNTSTDSVTYVAWFAVINPSTTSVNNATIIGNTYGPSGGNLSKNNLYLNGGSYSVLYRIVENGLSYSTSSGATQGVLTLVYAFTNYSNGQAQVFVNGTGGTLITTGPTGILDTASSALRIGWGGYPSNNGITGNICECLLYTFTGGNTLTTDQQQLVEGYLAWKWGIAGNLPENHPYKRMPPEAFSLYNKPYFVTATGGSAMSFTYAYNLSGTNAVNSIKVRFYATNGVTLIATSSELNPALTFTSDGTTNATTGKLDVALTLGQYYLANVTINITPSLGNAISAFSSILRYGAAAAVATSPTYTSPGAKNSSFTLTWSRANNTITTPMNNTFILFYTDSAGNGSSVSSSDLTTGTSLTTDGTTNATTGKLVSNLTFNTIYYFRVATSNIVNTSYTLSAVSSGALYGNTALAPSALGTPTGGANISISWTRNSTNAQPSNNTKVYFYTNAAGSTYGGESVDLGTSSSFTTNGTSATGQLLANLTFNTTYYLRVGTSNVLTTGAYQNSAAVTSAVTFGAAPIAGTITSYTGGVTMTATLGSTATLSQPISSSNIIFLSNDGVSVAATKTGYTGGASYSTTGVVGDFTSGGPLAFNTYYYLRLALVNSLGTTPTTTASTARFGDVPAAIPTNASFTSTVYYGTTATVNYTAPGAGTTVQPVEYVAWAGTGCFAGSFGFSIPNTATSISGLDSFNNYGISGTISLYSYNAIGSSVTETTTTNSAIVYQYSMGSYYNQTGSATNTQSWSTADHSATTLQVYASTISSGNIYVNTQILGGVTKTLSWSYTTTNITATIYVNGIARGTSGSITGVGNGVVSRIQWSSNKGGSTVVLNLTLS